MGQLLVEARQDSQGKKLEERFFSIICRIRGAYDCFETVYVSIIFSIMQARIIKSRTLKYSLGKFGFKIIHICDYICQIL